jgi:hypothetical protein
LFKLKSRGQCLLALISEQGVKEEEEEEEELGFGSKAGSKG